MKTYLRLAALLLLFANVCLAQIPIPGTPATLGNVGTLSDNAYVAGSFTTPAIPITSGQFAGMNYFKVECTPLSGSSITTSNVYIDSSNDGITWTQGGAISGQACSSETSATNGPVAANYVRVDIYSAGLGQVRVRLLGAMSSLAGGGGGGGVSSVGLSLPSGLFSVTGSPVTGSGTLTATFQTISPHLYLGNNTSSSAAAALVQPAFTDLIGSATTGQLPFTYTSTNSSTKLVTAGSTFSGSAGNGVCLDSNLNLVTSGCTGSMVYPTGNGIPIVVSGNSWGTTVAAPTGTVVGTSDTQTLTNKSIAGSEINSGTIVATVLPAALANSTSINGLNITASTGTLTITGSKTLTISNSMTLAGTDGTTQTFPTTSGTVITSVSTAGGDLSGTYPNPTVAKVNGLAVVTSKTIIGTNSSGQFIDATSSTLSNNTTGTAAGGATGFTIAGLADGCLHTVSNVVESTGSSCGGGGGMVYPSGSGFAVVVSGTSWGTTIATPTGAVVGAGQANTYSTGLQSFASATMSLPSSASYSPTTAGLFGYDSTNNRAVLGNGTNTSDLTWITAAPTTLDLAEFSGTLGALTDTGILTANVVTQTSNGAANQIAVYSTTNKVLVPTTTLPTAAEPAHTADVTNTAGSLAMKVVAINNTTFTGTANDLVAFGSTGIIPLDSGVLYTNLTTQTSNGAANQVCTYTGANKTCVPGSVTNAMLSNSSITINGTSNQITSSTATPALGGTTTLALASPLTFPGKWTAAASTTSAASANIPTGSAPTSPTSGDLWNLSGILQFYDGTNKNSLTSIQAAVTSGHCPQFSGTAGLMVDSGSVCPSISGLAATQVVVASSSTAITSYAGFTSDSSGNVTANSVTIASANPGISYFGQGTSAWGTGTTSVGLTAPTSVTSYNLVFPSAASTGTNASSGNFYMKFATTQNQTGCTASTTELCGYMESNIDLTADVGATILPAANGGTGNGFVAFTGPTTSTKTFTLPNASATILTNNAQVTVGQGGTGVNTLTQHAILLGEAAANVSSVGPCGSGVPLVGAGSSADPTCTTIAFTEITGGTSTSTAAFNLSPSATVGGSTANFSIIGPASETNTGAVLNVDTTSGGTTSVQPSFRAGIIGVAQLQVCEQAGPQGEVVFGSVVACPSIYTTTFAKTVFQSATAAHTLSRFWQSSASYSGDFLQLNTATAAGTGFNLLTMYTGVSGTDTFHTGGTLQFSIAGNGAITSAAAPGASGSALTLSGAPYAAGSATTNFPLFYLQGGSAPTTLSTAGTEFGINTPSGFTGLLIDGHVNGGSSVFSVNYQGNGAFSGTLTCSAAACLGSDTATTQAYGTSNTTVATTGFVANAIAGTNPATAVLIATTTSLTGTYVQVGGGIGDTFTITATGATTIDGVALTAIGQPVLLKNQSTASQNGIYTVTTVGTTGVSTVFTRSLDYDTVADVNNTGPIFVQSGTANAITSWLLTSQVTSIGSAGSSLTYSQSSSNPANLVLAVSPGVGIAHFAGSTQTVTSSLIVAADITSNTITGTQLASSLALTTPNIGAATGTSLIVSGVLDGTVPMTATTGTTATLGAGTYRSGYTANQEATAATAVTYTLPATVKGMQYCVYNDIVSGTGAPDTGVLTVYPPASSYVVLNGVINTIGGGGTHGVASGGAAADSACFVATDSTHWKVFVVTGTWTEN